MKGHTHSLTRKQNFHNMKKLERYIGQKTHQTFYRKASKQLQPWVEWNSEGTPTFALKISIS
jgi:hypothetical protein